MTLCQFRGTIKSSRKRAVFNRRYTDIKQTLGGEGYMIDNSDIDQFVKDKYPTVSGHSYTRIARTMERVQEYEKEINKPFEQFNQLESAKLFEKNNWTALNTFTSNRSIIREFAEWYFENVIGLDNFPFGHSKIPALEFIEIEDVSSDYRYKREYFNSEDDYFICLDTMFGNPTNKQHVMHKAFFSLMWAGLSRGEIRNLEVSDCRLENSQSLHISIADNTFFNRISVDNAISVDNILSAMSADGYELELEDGRKRYFEYNASDYVIKSVARGSSESTNNPASESVINGFYNEQQNLSKSLSPTNPYYMKGLYFRGISSSAAFIKLEQFEKNSHLIEKVNKDTIKIFSELTRTDMNRNTANAFYNNYRGWKNYFKK